MRTVRVAAAVAALTGALALGVSAVPSLAAVEELDGLIAYPIGGGEDPFLVRTVKPDGTHNRRLIGPRHKLFRLGPSSPEWSPDGKKLLFGGHDHLDTAAQSLWYSTASGKRIRRIRLGFRGARTGPGAITLHGWDWAPDGRRVVFAASKEPAAARLYTISIDGRHRRALRRRGSGPEWSSDGRYILFSLRPREPWEQYPARIAVVRPNGNGFRRLTDSTRDTFARFSPDGRRVLFIRNLDSPREQWRMVDITGQNDVAVGPDRPSNLGYCPPQWTPDGTRLAVVALEGEDQDVARFMTMSTTGADARVAFTFPRGFYGRHTICDFSWRPR
jgi:dipeptidyl aminopeptidase/acylaminoacyl peptidase